MTITTGTVLMQATNANHVITNDLSVAANGTLTNSVPIASSRYLSVLRDINVDGIINYTVASQVQMGGTGALNVRTGNNASSTFNILSLKTGNVSATGTTRADTIINTSGSLHTNGQSVYDGSGFTSSQNTLYIRWRNDGY